MPYQMSYAGERVRYEIVCVRCGRHDTVPFQPRRNAPLYCRSCYRDKMEFDRDRSILEMRLNGEGTLQEQLDACERILDFEPQHPFVPAHRCLVLNLMGEEAMKEGSQAMECGDAELAESHFLKAVNFNPDIGELVSPLISEAQRMKDRKRKALERERQKLKEDEIESVREWAKLWRDG